jgi:hypothetical protein
MQRIVNADGQLTHVDSTYDSTQENPYGDTYPCSAETQAGRGLQPDDSPLMGEVWTG